MSSLSQIADKIRNSNNIIIFTHVFPDPDAIGSAVGLAEGLSKLGKNVKAHVNIIPRMEVFVNTELVDLNVDFSHYELVIVVDTANRERVAGPEFKLPSINIDHHQSNTLWADLNYVDSKAPSSSLIVGELLAELGLKDTGANIANLLLAGLSDDTGSFRFSNASARAFEAAANFLKSGANPELVANNLYYSQKANRIKLQSLALQDLRFFLDGKVALLSLTQSLLDQCGASADDTDGLVDIARSVEGVEIAVFIRQFQDKWKASLRSKSGNVSVNDVAAKFGGGGHAAAAGCTLMGSLKEVEEKILTAIKEVL